MLGDELAQLHEALTCGTALGRCLHLGSSFHPAKRSASNKSKDALQLTAGRMKCTFTGTETAMSVGNSEDK
jgi:hypothetical protein